MVDVTWVSFATKHWWHLVKVRHKGNYLLCLVSNGTQNSCCATSSVNDADGFKMQAQKNVCPLSLDALLRAVTKRRFLVRFALERARLANFQLSFSELTNSFHHAACLDFPNVTGRDWFILIMKFLFFSSILCVFWILYIFCILCLKMAILCFISSWNANNKKKSYIELLHFAGVLKPPKNVSTILTAACHNVSLCFMAPAHHVMFGHFAKLAS